MNQLRGILPHNNNGLGSFDSGYYPLLVASGLVLPLFQF